jgi:hypothetical protein
MCLCTYVCARVCLLHLYVCVYVSLRMCVRARARLCMQQADVIIDYFSRRDALGYSAAVHAVAGGTQPALHVADAPSSRPRFSCAGSAYLKVLHVYDPAAGAWTDLGTPFLSAQAPRYHHGFTSAGGKLYVHGGVDGGYRSFDRVAGEMAGGRMRGLCASAL